jgi:hypothetical protein
LALAGSTLLVAPVQPLRRLSPRGWSAAVSLGCVQSLLDPTGFPGRTRPAPADVIRVSDATGIPFVELLEALWRIECSRLAEELGRLGLGGSADAHLAGLSEAERAEVRDFVDFLVARHPRGARTLSPLTNGPR